MFPPCGKWSITSSIISDRGSCFKPVHSDWFASASGAAKRGTQRNSFWVHARIDKHTGSGNLPILFCFLSACPCKTVAHFEQEVRMLEWLSNTIVLNMASHPLPKKCWTYFSKALTTYSLWYSVLQFGWDWHVYHTQTEEAEDEQEAD